MMDYFDNVASIFLETIVKEVIDFECINNGIHEMTIDEINCVSGAGATTAGAALGVAGAIGAAIFGSTWGAVAVGAAFTAAPFAVVAMAGLAAYAGYSYFSAGGGTGGDKKPVMAR
jgi:hypothetical protein